MKQLHQRLGLASLWLGILLPQTACENSEKAPASTTPAQSAISVEVAPVQQVSAKELRQTLSARLEALQSTQLGFQMPGKVTAVYCKEGEAVSAGKLLARLDDEEIRLGLEAAQIALAQAEDLFGRLKKSYEAGNLPEKDYTEADFRVRLARNQVSQLQKKLRETALYAPCSGTVAMRQLEGGNNVAPGQPVFTLVQVDQLYARAAAPASQVQQLRPGTVVNVTVPALGHTQNATVESINPVPDPTTLTYGVKVKVNNDDGRLLPGMLAQLQWQGGSVGARLLVNTQALLKSPGQESFVFVVDQAKKKAVKRTVTAGQLLGSTVEILQGLNASDQVVTAGNQKLEDGAALSIR